MNLRRLVLALSVLSLSAAGLAPLVARADAPAGKNLQILPKNMTKEQIKLVMKAQSKALGVECDFCHDVPDMASDKYDHKKIARDMMKLTDDLNAKWFNGKNNLKQQVTCNTCHRGKEKPEKD